MSNTANRNAFPYVNGPVIHTGMTMHMYFAGQALTGLLARDLTSNSLGNNHVNHAYVRRDDDALGIARLAWQIADVMCQAYDAEQKKRGYK